MKTSMKTSMNKILLAICMLTAVACEKFLEEDPKGRLSDADFFSNKKELQLAVNALYAKVYLYTWSNDRHVNLWASDDISTHPASNKQYLREYDSYSVSENNTWMATKWNALYVVVKAANYVINNAPRTIGASADDISHAIAQAAYWRGYAYFHLVQTWGAVPIMLENEINYNAPLSPIDSVYARVIEDLQTAENAPVKWNVEPQVLNGINVAVSQGAAKATLAYVYLSMAGWPLNKGNEYYQLAAAKAKEVIDLVESKTYYYTLLDDYHDVYSLKYNLNNPEIVMGFYYNFAGGWQGGANLSPWADIPLDNNGWGDSNGEIKFWYDFPSGPRKNATYAPETYRQSDNSMQDWWWDTSPSSREVVAPWFIKVAEGSNGEEWDVAKGGFQGNFTGAKTHHIVRLSEVYCWYAEALGRSGQTDPKAIELLNKVRNRADGVESNIYPAGMTPTELAEAAYNEHGWEIAGYYWGNIAPRYYDMFRMNRVSAHFEYRKTNPLITVSSGTNRNEGVTVSGTWNDKMMYSPYPLEERLLNPNLINN
jgi:hypothetical protein